MKYLRTKKSTLAAFIVLLSSFAAKAQGTASGPDMADVMRSNGKIYVVVAVLTVIFIGIVIYMISLDMKLKRLEKLIRNK
jgi:CcmD family protein